MFYVMLQINRRVVFFGVEETLEAATLLLKMEMLEKGNRARGQIMFSEVPLSIEMMLYRG